MCELYHLPMLAHHYSLLPHDMQFLSWINLDFHVLFYFLGKFTCQKRFMVLSSYLPLKTCWNRCFLHLVLLCKNTFFCVNSTPNLCLSVGIALGYGLDGRGSGVRFPSGAGNFSLHHRVQKDSGAHPASYPMGTRSSFPGGKAAGA
jgi:hypothetical protein